MLEEINSGSILSRREFVAASAAVVSAAVLPSGAAMAQTPAKFRRMNISEPGFPMRVLDSYKKAITKMLALPPTDPRNWYRHTLIHTLDCPHGNWWFLVWHRGYTGWFEQICRELSEDPDFALPYWDWTKEPKVPDAMFDDVLTPTNPTYKATFADFKSTFQDAVAQADYWKLLPDGTPNDQYNQLLARSIRFPDDLWFDINDKNPAGGMFFDLAHARGLTRDKPQFSDDVTKKAVALPMILDALGPRDFLTFASPKTLAHSSTTGFGVLEGQPHNKVHNNVGGVTVNIVNGQVQVTNVGGFMQAFLSPVDPLFFLHHANMDRLWDVWTRKQQGRAAPQGASGAVTLPETLLNATGAEAPKLFAKVTVAFPPLTHPNDLAVVVGGETTTLSVFGHHRMLEPLTFTVPVSGPVKTLRANNQLAANAPLNIRVVQGTSVAPHAAAAVHGTQRKPEVLSITVEAH